MTAQDQAATASAPGAVAAPLTLAELAATVAQLSARVASLEAKQPGEPPAPTVAAPVAVVPPAAAPVKAVPADANLEVRQLLEQLFALTLATDHLDEEAIANQFEIFRTLVHSDRQGSPVLDTDLRRYKWRPLLGRYTDYLFTVDQPASFQIERMIPDRIDARTETIKIHLAVRGGRRMAPPVTLRRDPRFAGALRIEQMSL
jgi:hypothetical protein